MTMAEAASASSGGGGRFLFKGEVTSATGVLLGRPFFLGVGVVLDLRWARRSSRSKARARSSAALAAAAKAASPPPRDLRGVIMPYCKSVFLFVKLESSSFRYSQLLVARSSMLVL